jgi:hypothetical protein
MLVMQFQENPFKGCQDMDENVYRFTSKMLLWYPESKQTNTVWRAWELPLLREVEEKIVNEDNMQKQMFTARSLRALLTDCSGWRISVITEVLHWWKEVGLQAWGGTVGWSLSYEMEGRWINFRWFQMNAFILNFSPHCGPVINLDTSRNEYPLSTDLQQNYIAHRALVKSASCKFAGKSLKWNQK